MRKPIPTPIPGRFQARSAALAQLVATSGRGHRGRRGRNLPQEESSQAGTREPRCQRVAGQPCRAARRGRRQPGGVRVVPASPLAAEGGVPNRPVGVVLRKSGVNSGVTRSRARQAVRELLAARRRAVHEVWMMEGTDPAAILREIQSLSHREPRSRAACESTPDPTGAGVRSTSGRDRFRRAPGRGRPLRAGRLGAGCRRVAGQPRWHRRSRNRRRRNRRRRTRGGKAEGGDLSPVESGNPHRAVRQLKAGKMAFLVVVDGVTDPQNLGALLRSAESAGVTGVVLSRHRSAHVTPTVTKVAAGAVEHVSIAVVPGVPGALQELERLGVWTIGLDERGSEPIFSLGLGDRPVALVIGAEGRGLSPLASTLRRARVPLCTAPSTRSTSRRLEPSRCSKSRAGEFLAGWVVPAASGWSGRSRLVG